MCARMVHGLDFVYHQPLTMASKRRVVVRDLWVFSLIKTKVRKLPLLDYFLGIHTCSQSFMCITKFADRLPRYKAALLAVLVLC